MAESRVLVAGANGQLGSVIVRKLAAAGVPVRAVGRNAQKLESLRAPGVEVVPVDLMNLAALTAACRGVGQIVSTANNNMGTGATSPAKIDLTAHQNLCAAARNAGMRRFLYVSAHGHRPGLAGRYLPHQAVHRRRDPPQRRAVRHPAPDGIHGRLDGSNHRRPDPQERRGHDLRRRHRAAPTTSPWTMWPSSW